jgi:hypothetical protein
MNNDQESGNDVSNVFEKSVSLISCPQAFSCWCSPQSLRTCSSMFVPSSANIQKNSRRMLTMPTAALDSKIPCNLVQMSGAVIAWSMYTKYSSEIRKQISFLAFLSFFFHSAIASPSSVVTLSALAEVGFISVPLVRSHRSWSSRIHSRCLHHAV